MFPETVAMGLKEWIKSRRKNCFLQHIDMASRYNALDLKKIKEKESCWWKHFQNMDKMFWKFKEDTSSTNTTSASNEVEFQKRVERN